jgi:D-serine dehydratase
MDLQALRRGDPVVWMRDASGVGPDTAPHPGLDMYSAVDRFRRFAPLLALLFPELEPHQGVIESELLPTPRLQQAIGLPQESGALFVKADHGLPVAGSIKARGGIHEVLEHAEAVALQEGLLTDGEDYRSLAQPRARSAFARRQIAVGSTGNLGLAIGVMASALGFRAVVHMSADAREWKKERLRGRGVTVVEHAGDYGAAVAAGRQLARSDPLCHFVDDEHSASLFLGYAAAAPRLAAQLEAAGRLVDAQHPLFVYLPCGVGGAPGGIAFGLAQLFGGNVHCIFAEPTQSPCFLLQMLVGTPGWEFLGENPSVYDIGLSNTTEADGLAVPRASLLAAAAAGAFVRGVHTVRDETLFSLLKAAYVHEGLRIEPSAAAGVAGPTSLIQSSSGIEFLEKANLLAHMRNATHVAWTTGGLFVPGEEHARYLARAEAVDQA